MSTSALVPFDSGKLPARLQGKKDTALPAWAISNSFPVVSIKGKVFTLKRGDTKTIIYKPDSDDEPASSLEVVIVRASDGFAKTYYESGYTEGSDEKPACYSNDGIAPASDAQEPQSKKCATCAQNVFGSRISDAGKKAKSCSDVVRLAIATPDMVNDPMLVRVPAASIKGLREFYKLLASRGVALEDVVTKIGFDYTVAHPALTFKPIGFVPDDVAEEVAAVKTTDVVTQIIGASPVHAEDDDDTPAPTKKAAAPAAKKTVAIEDDEDEAAPVVKKVTKKTPVVEVAGGSALVEELGEMLDGLDLDD